MSSCDGAASVVCLCVRLSVNFFAGIATTTPKMARSLPNLHRMVSTWARIHVVHTMVPRCGCIQGCAQGQGQGQGSRARGSFVLARETLLLRGKWSDCDQTCTQWSPGQHAYRMCPVSRSRLKVTWYGHFCARPKIAFSRRQIARLRPNLHTMVPRCACIHIVLKVKVKVKGHVIRALLSST